MDLEKDNFRDDNVSCHGWKTTEENWRARRKRFAKRGSRSWLIVGEEPEEEAPAPSLRPKPAAKKPAKKAAKKKAAPKKKAKKSKPKKKAAKKKTKKTAKKKKKR